MIIWISLASLGSSKDSLYNSNSTWYLELVTLLANFLECIIIMTNIAITKFDSLSIFLLLSQPVQLLPLMSIHCPQSFHLCPSQVDLFWIVFSMTKCVVQLLVHKSKIQLSPRHGSLLFSLMLQNLQPHGQLLKSLPGDKKDDV